MTDEQKNMSEIRAKSFEKDFSEQEMLKNNPLFFAYRDNDLFQKYVPVITKKLNEFGRNTETQIFEAGTSVWDMRRWYKTLFYTDEASKLSERSSDRFDVRNKDTGGLIEPHLSPVFNKVIITDGYVAESGYDIYLDLIEKYSMFKCVKIPMLDILISKALHGALFGLSETGFESLSDNVSYKTVMRTFFESFLKNPENQPEKNNSSLRLHG